MAPIRCCIGLEVWLTNWSPSSGVHLVFHVSFLNKVIGDKILFQTILPEMNEEGKII
jgi:hypothetical protein